MIFFLCFILIIFSINFILIEGQRRQANRVLNNLKQENLKHLKVTYLPSNKYSNGYNGPLFAIKAELYFNDEFILICPKRRGIYLGINTFNLPLIITNNIPRVMEKARTSTVLKPSYINITAWNALIIKSKTRKIIETDYKIQIKLINKEDAPVLNSLKQSQLFLEESTTP